MTEGRKDYLAQAIKYIDASYVHSKCTRLSVACLAFPPYRPGFGLQHDKIAAGHNTAHKGNPEHADGLLHNCRDDGHLMIDDHCVRTIHAEQLMLINAMHNGINIAGHSLAVSHTPCITCSILIIEAGIKEIFIGAEYKPNPITFQWLTNAGIKVYDWNFNPIKW